MAFWKNIKEGYDYFLLHKKRPNFTINKTGKYVFTKPLIQEEGNH